MNNDIAKLDCSLDVIHTYSRRKRKMVFKCLESNLPPLPDCNILPFFLFGSLEIKGGFLPKKVNSMNFKNANQVVGRLSAGR